jgi:quinol monooxygenase YgiN
MYAMTGKLVAQSGKRAELVEILKQASDLVGMIPQCFLYLVNVDLANETHIWIYELWDDKESHDASLSNEQVRALISKAKPLLAAAPDGAELLAVGGHGVDFNQS